MNTGVWDQVEQEDGDTRGVIRRALHASVLPDQVEGSLGCILFPPQAMCGVGVPKNMLKMVAPVDLHVVCT